MKNNRKKVMILTNHSYMLYRFRKELIEELMKNYDVVLSMPLSLIHISEPTRPY